MSITESGNERGRERKTERENVTFIMEYPNKPLNSAILTSGRLF